MNNFAQFWDRFHCLFAVFIVVTTVSFAYSNSLQVPFHLDDIHNIIDNPKIKISELTPTNLFRAARESPSKSRLLSNISFALNYYYGGREVFGYHLVNVFIHIATALLLYIFILKEHQNNKTQAAEALGITRQTIISKLKQYENRQI